MTSYRFLNRDHSLALRDEQFVIAWDAQKGEPAEPQPSGAQGELQIWKDAGSPKPLEANGGEEPPAEIPPLPSFRFLLGAPPPAMPEEQSIPLGEHLAELAKVEAALPELAPDDFAGLREQVQALAAVVHHILKPEEEEPKT